VIAGVINIVISLLKMIVGLVQAFVTGDMSLLLEGWNQFAKGIGQLLGGVWDIIKGFFGGIILAVAQFVMGFLGFFQGLYDSLVGNSIIPDMVNGIVDWIAQLPKRVMAFVTKLVTDFIVSVLTLAMRVGLGFSMLVSMAVKFLENLPSEIRRLMTAAYNAAVAIVKDFSNIGKNIVAGIKAGIVNAWDGLLSKIKTLVDKLPAGVKKFLNIQSPSRVFAAIGAQIPAGMAMGIESGLSMLSSASQNMATAMNPAINGGYSMTTTQTVVHRVEFGKVPEGVGVNFTARDVADMLNRDQTAAKTVARAVVRATNGDKR
jgi:phage-related protein